MSGELFYNVHPHVAEARLIHQWLTWKPRAVVVMNNPGLALRLQELRPEALVIYRRWPDDQVKDLGNPLDWLLRMTADVPDTRIILYAGNEIHGSPGIADWTLEAMSLATTARRRLCILNCGTGGPEDEEWWADTPTPTAPRDNPLPAHRIGALDPVARAWAVSNHLLGLHEYADGLDWRRDRGWQVGRYNRHLDTFAAMGITVPREVLRARLVITEATFDSTPVSEWKGARWLPAREAAGQMIEMAREEYRGIPLAMYCLGHNNDPQWRKFRLDFGAWEEVGLDEWGETFQAVIGDYMMSEGEGDMEGFSKAVVRVKSAVGLKRRTAPGTKAPTLSTGLAQGEHELMVSVSPILADGYVWRGMTGGGDVWWSATGPAANPFEWADVIWTEAPPVDPDPDPDPGEPPADPGPVLPDPMTPERWLVLLEAWDESLANLDTVINQAAHETRIAIDAASHGASAVIAELRGVLLETMEAIERERDEQPAEAEALLVE